MPVHTSNWKVENVVWFVHKTNGGHQENADVRHHLCELTENAPLIAQPMRDGTPLSVFVWMDFSESMAYVLLAQLEPFTTQQLGTVKIYAGSTKSPMAPNVFVGRISSESTQYAPNALLEQVTIQQLKDVWHVVRTKSN